MMTEFDLILKEATQQVEDALSIEDAGWVNLSAMTSEVIPQDQRITTVKEARLYSLKDPLARQSIRLMTDYAFGSGFSWNTEDKNVENLLTSFWDSAMNGPLLSPKGQRKSSDKLLIDGEIFFAVFLGNEPTIRRIDPLQITEILTDPDDVENVKYYKRDWSDAQGSSHTDYYCSFTNLEDDECKDSLGTTRKKTQDALVYHLAINDLGQRGNSYLLPVLEWIKLYRRFLASRVAVMLALARFAWKLKTQGGQTTVDALKAVYHEKEVKAGSTAIENQAADLQPIKTDSGASGAYQDGRQLKLQVSAGTGWPEQYYGDISIGNLATAKTVELPVQKMCESYQSIWRGAYADIFNLILGEETYIDIDFPKVSEEMSQTIAESLASICSTFPEFADSQDVQQIALMALGITDVNEVLEDLQSNKGDKNLALAKALKGFQGLLKAQQMNQVIPPGEQNGLNRPPTE